MKKLTLVILFILLSGYSAILTFQYLEQYLQVCFAEEQIKIFFRLKKDIYSSEKNAEIALKLAYLVDYYPSGTKQKKGSRLDILVENTRKNVIEDILAFLKNKTGKNFGANPKIWIEKMKDNT
jgi:hypothetical protein